MNLLLPVQLEKQSASSGIADMVVEVLLHEKLPRTILSRGPREMGPQALHQDPERGWEFFKGALAQRRPGEDEVGRIRGGGYRGSQ